MTTFDTQVSATESIAKEIAIIIKLAEPSIELSAIGGMELGGGVTYSQLERLSVDACAKSFMMTRNAVSECIGRLTDIRKSLDMGKGDALTLLNAPNPAPTDTRMKNLLRSLKQECDDFAKQLDLTARLHRHVMGIPDPDPVNPDPIKQKLVNSLGNVIDKRIVDPLRSFSGACKNCETADDLFKFIKSSVDRGCAADELLSWSSFEDVIDTILQYNDESRSPSQYVRRGCLRLSAFECTCFEYLETSENVRLDLEKAKRVDYLSDELHQFVDMKWVTPMSLLDCVSDFIHKVLRVLSEMNISRGGADDDDDNGFYAHEAFKQFVKMYDVQNQVLSDLRQVRQVVQAEALDEAIIQRGRSYLFSAEVLSLGPSVQFSDMRNLRTVDLDSILDHRRKKVKIHVFSDVVVFACEGKTETWDIKDLRSVQVAFHQPGRVSSSTFIIERSTSEGHKAGFYYFRCNASRKMEVVDMKSLMERLQMAIKSHAERNVLTHRLVDMENDYNIACDGLPRLFIHAVAWILANDMKVEGPFRQAPRRVVQNEMNVMVSNGYMPLYSSHVPEALIKEWLKMIPGCVIDFSEEWRIKSSANSFYELATKIDTKMNVSQRKMFAVMVALAHCIVRHHKTTRLETNPAIATVFAQNVFSLEHVLAHDLPRMTTLANITFTEILNQTSTPEQFRRLFFSLFPGTPQPQLTVVATRPAIPATRPAPSMAAHGAPPSRPPPTTRPPPVSRIVPVTLSPAVGSAGGAGAVLSESLTNINRAAARRRSRRERSRAPRLDAREILNRPQPQLPPRPGQLPLERGENDDDDDDDTFEKLIPTSPTLP